MRLRSSAIIHAHPRKCRACACSHALHMSIDSRQQDRALASTPLAMVGRNSATSQLNNLHSESDRTKQNLATRHSDTRTPNPRSFGVWEFRVYTCTFSASFTAQTSDQKLQIVIKTSPMPRALGVSTACFKQGHTCSSCS